MGRMLNTILRYLDIGKTGPLAKRRFAVARGKTVAEILSFGNHSLVILPSMQRSPDAALSRSSGSSSDLNQTRTVNFARVVSQPALLASFAKWCSANLCEENLLFWQHVQDFKKLPPESDQLALDGKTICNKFIREGSPSQVNIDSATRKKLLQDLENAEWSSRTFDAAEKQIFHLIVSDSLPKFFVSSHWQDVERFVDDIPIPYFIDKCCAIVERNLKYADLLEISPEDDRIAATLLHTGEMADITDARLALAALRISLLKEKGLLIPPHLQLFLYVAVSREDPKDRLAAVRQVIRTLSLKNQATLYRLLSLVQRLSYYHKTDSLTRLFAPLIMKSSRRVNTPSSAVFERNRKTLAELMELVGDIFRPTEDPLQIVGSPGSQTSPTASSDKPTFFEAPLDLQSVFAADLKDMGVSIPPPNAELAEKDWQLFLTGAKTATFSPGQTIINAGEPFSWLYYVQQGSAVMQRVIDNETFETVVTVTPAKTFGEHAVVAEDNQAISTYQITADPEKGAELALISPEFVFRVAESHPELGRRFCLFLARKLAKLLWFQDIPSKRLARRTASVLQFRRDDPDEVKRGAKLQERFDVSPHEVVVYDCAAILLKSQKWHGSLTLTQNNLLFWAQVFGFKTKKLVPIRSISDLGCDDAKNEVTVEYDGSKKILWFRLEKVHYNELKTLLSSLWQATVGEDIVARDKPLSKPDVVCVVGSARRLQHNHLRMTREDWGLLLAGEDTFASFKKGDVVVKMGQEYASLYQIVSGSCRIELEDKRTKASHVIGMLKPGEIFGEISFLTGGVATASVLAEEATSVYVLDAVYLAQIFHADPLLAARLYYYLASQIADRLYSRSDKTRSLSPPRRSTSSSSNG